MYNRQVEWIEPVEAASRLARLPSVSLLESVMRHPTLGRYSYLAADPFGIFRIRNGTAFWNDRPEAAEPLTALRRRLDACRIVRLSGVPPFQGGAIGTFAYEWGWVLEGRRPPSAGHGDDVYLAFHDVVVAFDHVERKCWVIASGLPETSRESRRDRAMRRLAEVGAALGCETTRGDADAAPVDWRAAVSKATYRAGVECVKAYIRDGDIYQANIAQRFVAPMPRGIDGLSIYRRLRRSNPAPFAAYLEQGARTILSSSPELFLRLDGRDVETRPIKGTARRVDDESMDRDARRALLSSRKDRAENVMIVDLLRNDLSKVCVPDSVEVPALCCLESYAGLHHLVSQVTGMLRADADALDLVAAAFPGGSVTGAPKLRAMEIIAEIEREPRGIYCGAIGALGFDGSVDLNIAIRTVVIENGTMDLRVGGGITILSDPDREFDETLTKAHRIFAALSRSRALAEACA